MLGIYLFSLLLTQAYPCGYSSNVVARDSKFDTRDAHCDDLVKRKDLIHISHDAEAETASEAKDDVGSLDARDADVKVRDTVSKVSVFPTPQ